MKEERTMEEMNEQYKDCPMRTAEYEVDGKKYIAHSHFVGTKDLDVVIGKVRYNGFVESGTALILEGVELWQSRPNIT